MIASYNSAKLRNALCRSERVVPRYPLTPPRLFEPISSSSQGFPYSQKKRANTRVRTTIAVLMALVTFACDKKSNPVDSRPTPGELTLFWLRGLNKAVAEFVEKEKASDTLFFNLGDIKATTSFYFVLNNVGDNNVIDCRIDVPDTNFVIYPTSVDTLPPNPDFRIDKLHILKLTSLHGTTVTGLSVNKLMTAGEHSCPLSVVGETRDEANSKLTTELSALVRVNALVMDATIFDGPKQLDLLHPNGSSLRAGEFYSSLINFWIISDSVRINNVGNVPFVVYNISQMRYDRLSPGATIEVGYRTDIWVYLDGLGVVSDVARFPRLIDGRTYFHFVPG